jgi:transcriptional regulator with XRE-family HTH domain
MVLGTKLKKIREFKNLTQEYVSEKLNMSQSNYSRIESNEVDIPFTKLQQIAEVLEVKVNDLIEFDAKYFFNNVSAQTINGDLNVTSERERALYEQQIDLLKNENSYLKSLLNKALVK